MGIFLFHAATCYVSDMSHSQHWGTGTDAFELTHLQIGAFAPALSAAACAAGRLKRPMPGGARNLRVMGSTQSVATKGACEMGKV